MNYMKNILILSILNFIVIFCTDEETKQKKYSRIARYEKNNLKKKTEEKVTKKGSNDFKDQKIKNKVSKNITGYKNIIISDLKNQKELIPYPSLASYQNCIDSGKKPFQCRPVWISKEYEVKEIFKDEICEKQWVMGNYKPKTRCVRLREYQKLKDGKEYLYGRNFHTNPPGVIQMDTNGQVIRKFSINKTDPLLFESIAVDKDGNIYGGHAKDLTPDSAEKTGHKIAVQKIDQSGNISNYLSYRSDWAKKTRSGSQIKDLDSLNKFHGIYTNKLTTDNRGRLYNIAHCSVCDPGNNTYILCHDSKGWCELATVTSIRRLTAAENQEIFLAGSNVYGDDFNIVTAANSDCFNNGGQPTFEKGRCISDPHAYRTIYTSLPAFISMFGKYDGIASDIEGEDVYVFSETMTYHDDTWEIVRKFLKEKRCPNMKDSWGQKACAGSDEDLRDWKGAGPQIIRMNQDKKVLASMIYLPVDLDIIKQALPHPHKNELPSFEKHAVISLVGVLRLDGDHNIYHLASLSSNSLLGLQGIVKITPDGFMTIVAAFLVDTTLFGGPLFSADGLKSFVNDFFLVDFHGNIYIRNLKLINKI